MKASQEDIARATKLTQDLQARRNHWTVRLARKLDLLEQYLCHGSLRRRLWFIGIVFRGFLGRRAIQLPLTATGEAPVSEAYAFLRSIVESAAVPAEEEAILREPTAFPIVKERRLRPHGKRRVAILTNQFFNVLVDKPTFGGGERYLLSLARLLEELGLEVEVFQTSHSPFQRRLHGLPVTGLGRGWEESYNEFGYGDCTDFTRRTADFDHVIHNLPTLASGEVREDAVVICHGLWFDHSLYGYSNARSGEWYRHLGRAFAGGRTLVSVDNNSIAFLRALWPALATRAKWVPNFFDGAHFFPKPGPENSPLQVLFPRRADRARGSRLVPEILERVPAKVEFHWVGGGYESEESLLRQLTLRDSRFHFHEASFESMSPWYWRSDITVIPTVGGEGTSLSCLEALACGNPTVATRVGGLPEIVRDGYNGRVVDPTAAAVAEAINALLESPGERARLRQVASSSVQGFEIGRWRARWTEIFRELGWTDAQMPRAPVSQKRFEERPPSL